MIVTVSLFVTSEPQDGIQDSVTGTIRDTRHLYNRILKLAKQCQFEPEEEKSSLIDAVIYGRSIVKAQEKLLQTLKSLTLSQCLSICRHYESLKLHLDTIKPKSAEYLQWRHPKPKGRGRGQRRPNVQPKLGQTCHCKWSQTRKSVKCYRCGSDVKHFKNRCPA